MKTPDSVRRIVSCLYIPFIPDMMDGAPAINFKPPNTRRPDIMEPQASAAPADISRVLNALADIIAPRIAELVEQRLTTELPRFAELMAKELSEEVVGKVKPLDPMQTYSKAEVAEMLHVSEDTLERLAKRGVLCPIPSLGAVRYAAREVARFINAEPADGYRAPLPAWARARAAA